MRLSCDCARVTPLCFRRMVSCGVPPRFRPCYGNCIWDALGIPAMLGHNARIDASCGCCNLGMLLKVANGRLLGSKGIIHIAVAARDWYKDIVFT